MQEDAQQEAGERVREGQALADRARVCRTEGGGAACRADWLGPEQADWLGPEQADWLGPGQADWLGQALWRRVRGGAELAAGGWGEGRLTHRGPVEKKDAGTQRMLLTMVALFTIRATDADGPGKIHNQESSQHRASTMDSVA